MDNGRAATVPDGAVVVGVDGAGHALAATRWAAREAASRHAPLIITHAAPHLPASPTPEQARHATGVLARARAVAQRDHAGIDIRTELLAVPPVPALVRMSERAGLLVLGLTGSGSADEILLGSTTLAVAARSHCPTSGVRAWPLSPAHRTGILLGVGSAQADADAAELAFDLADRRRCALTVVHSRFRDHGGPGSDPDRASWRQANMLVWQLRQWRYRHPALQVSIEVVEHDPATELLRRARGAEAIVVGSRKKGLAARALLGSTGRALLRYSGVPVLIAGPNSTRRTDRATPDRAGQPRATVQL